MKPTLAIYVWGTIAAALGGVISTWGQAAALPSVVTGGLIAYWLFLSLAAECFWLETPSGNGMVSMSLAVNLGSLFVLPAPWALLVAGTSVFVADLALHRRPWLKAAFNGGQTTVAMTFASWVLQGSTEGADPILWDARVLLVPAVFFVFNTGLVSGVISLDSGDRFFRVWKENYGHLYHALSTIVLFVIGVSFVTTYHEFGYLTGLAYLLVFLFIRDAYHRYVGERRARLEKERTEIREEETKSEAA